MGDLLIKDIDKELYDALAESARANGRSLEEEGRVIITRVLDELEAASPAGRADTK